MEMLSLPRPLDRGGLYLDEEKLQQSFRIDALGPITLRGGNASVPRHLPSGTAVPRCGKSKGYVRHFKYLAYHLGAFFAVFELTGAQAIFLLKDLGKITPTCKPNGVDHFGYVHFGSGYVIAGQLQSGMAYVFRYRFVVQQFEPFL